MDRIFLAILIAFGLGIIISPIIIRFARKLKANQTIYEYVDMHQKKKGTPTMGGVIFILAILVSALCLLRSSGILTIVSLVVMLAYGVLGFLDDFIKVKLKRNLGLRAYQKIIGQLAIAIIVSVFAYQNGYVGSTILVPFTNISLDLGIWFIPFTVFVFLSTTNSVNLTDGLDGLASGVSLSFLACFGVLYFILLSGQTVLNADLIAEQQNLLVLVGASIGGLMAYLIHNCYPASIFMGDTGSLALGGLIASIMVFTKQMLLIPLLGIMFVVSAVSVSVQVIYYKLTKKRVFLMAPYHHHLEKKGMYETKIVVIYIIVTLVAGILGILLTILL